MMRILLVVVISIVSHSIQAVGSIGASEGSSDFVSRFSEISAQYSYRYSEVSVDEYSTIVNEHYSQSLLTSIKSVDGEDGNLCKKVFPLGYVEAPVNSSASSMGSVDAYRNGREKELGFAEKSNNSEKVIKDESASQVKFGTTIEIVEQVCDFIDFDNEEFDLEDADIEVIRQKEKRLSMLCLINKIFTEIDKQQNKFCNSMSNEALTENIKQAYKNELIDMLEFGRNKSRELAEIKVSVGDRNFNIKYDQVVAKLDSISDSLSKRIYKSDDLPDRSLQPLVNAQVDVSSNVKLLLSGASISHSIWLDSELKDDSGFFNSKKRKIARIKGIANNSTKKSKDIVAVNAALSNYYRKFESKLYRSDSQQPKLCLALSGGGIRSATVSIGVLQALYKNKLLEKVDIISGVSGGAYATGWYSVHRSLGKSDYDLFQDDSYIMQTIKPDLLKIEIAALGAVGNVLNPLTRGSSFVNGFDVTSSSVSYWTMLQRSFSSENVKTSDLTELILKHDMPMPIIGISAYPLDRRLYDPVPDNDDCIFDNDEYVDSCLYEELALPERSKSVALHDTYLEYTPFRFGVPGFGYSDVSVSPGWDHFFDVVATSGAAYDDVHNKNSATKLAELLTLGGHLSLVLPKIYPLISEEKLTSSNSRQQYFYATDGGFVENLAVYPLILRRCETIMIVDAEYDPYWVFEGYSVLKTRLLNEHNVVLHIPEIEELSNKNKAGEYTRADNIDLPKTPVDPATGKNMDCRSTEKYDDSCPARSAKNLIFTGALIQPPITNKEILNPKTSRIIYMKLGLINDEILNLRYSVAVKSMIQNCQNNPGDCYFPQEPTFNLENKLISQQFNDDQFKAYKGIGEFLGEMGSKQFYSH